MNDLDWKISESKRVIRTAIAKWGNSCGIAFTGRKDSSVMFHIIRQITAKPPKAMFIDHGMHFSESYRQISKLRNLWNIDLLVVTDKKLLKKIQLEKDPETVMETISKLKITTINNTIRNNKWKALFTAIRWDEHPARSEEIYFSKRENHYRIHPILHFTEKDIWDYIKRNKIPYNSLYDEGYRSIGATVFTKKSNDNEVERSGREADKEQIMGRLRKLGYF